MKGALKHLKDDKEFWERNRRQAARTLLSSLYWIREDTDKNENHSGASTNVEIYNRDLDASQRKAVERCNGPNPITIIHGPPGQNLFLTCGILWTVNIFYEHIKR